MNKDNDKDRFSPKELIEWDFGDQPKEIPAYWKPHIEKYGGIPELVKELQNNDELKKQLFEEYQKINEFISFALFIFLFVVGLSQPMKIEEIEESNRND